MYWCHTVPHFDDGGINTMVLVEVRSAAQWSSTNGMTLGSSWLLFVVLIILIVVHLSNEWSIVHVQQRTFNGAGCIVGILLLQQCHQGNNSTTCAWRCQARMVDCCIKLSVHHWLSYTTMHFKQWRMHVWRWLVDYHYCYIVVIGGVVLFLLLQWLLCEEIELLHKMW